MLPEGPAEHGARPRPVPKRVRHGSVWVSVVVVVVWVLCEVELVAEECVWVVELV